MLSIIGVSTSYMLIDMAMALIALAVGFFGALWYQRNIVGVSHDTADSPEVVLEKEAAANEAERANMAAMQLRDLAMNVATDIGQHNTMIADISENLNGDDTGSGSAAVDAVSQILAANEKLQNRLADAEQKIQTQAEEIRTKQSEARTDALTKLPNRRAFDDAMKSNVKAFTSKSHPFSLLIFDVDHFKKFNDVHGHQAGDEVLRYVGKTMSEVVKNEDVPCRYGGEEFALVMPNTKINEARTAAERVRKAIEAMEIDFEGKSLKVTVSIGVAEIASVDNTTTLVRRADDSVYASKEAGRNRGFWHDGDSCRPLEDTAATTSKAIPTLAPEVSSSENIQPVRLNDLPDRAVFTGELHRRINESHRFGVSLSVMHLSVKDYANLEKEYGNAVGKLLLESVAQFIRSTLREMDLLGKLESGEFIVMLPGSTEREAKLVGSRVETAIANCVIPLGDNRLRLEISPGVTGVQPNDEAPTMIARAKEVMIRQLEKNLAVN